MENNNRKTNIFITGATSFLGYNLIKYLNKNDYEIYAILRKSSKKINDAKNVLGDEHLIYIDMNEDSQELIDRSIENFLNNNNLDSNNIFIHMAWDSSSELGRNDEKLQKKNYEGSVKITKVLEKLKINKFIFTSSQADKNNTAYGRYKKQFLEYVRSNIKNSICLRIFSMYGENDYHNSIITYIRNCILNNEDCYVGPCDYMWNYLHIDDFVKIMDLFIKKEDIDYSLIYDVASDDTKLLKEYLKYFEENYNLKIHYDNSKINIEPFDIPNITNLLKVIGEYKFKKFNYEIKEKKI